MYGAIQFRTSRMPASVYWIIPVMLCAASGLLIIPLKERRTRLLVLEQLRRAPDSVVWIDAGLGGLTLRTDQGRSVTLMITMAAMEEIVPLLRARCPDAVVTTDVRRQELERQWRQDPASLRCTRR
jgi:hypothetical protein